MQISEREPKLIPENDPRRGLTQRALWLLLRRLGEDSEKAAREYEAIRQGLRVFFEMRGLPDAEALADETIDRVARRIDGGEQIEHPRAYVYGVARNVALESERHRARERVAIEGHRALQAMADAADVVEARIVCLGRCLARLAPQSRALIVDYYRGRGGTYLQERRLLAERLGISYASLKTRAHRIRNALEPCLLECLQKAGGGHQ